MKVALKPVNEQERLAALKQYNLLDTLPEKDFDEIVSLASMICQTPVSLITLVDENRQWFKSRVGFDQEETHRDLAFCAHVINDEHVMVVPDATKDLRFFDNPLVTGHPDIRFYAGTPLVNPEGYKVGTLCVIDNKPKTLTDIQLQSLKVLSKQVMKQMEFRKKVIELERLNDNNHKLLSLISHDLKSPFASLYGLLELVENYDMPVDEFKSLIPDVKRGFTAANGLLTNLLEWATSQFSENEIKRIPFSIESVANYTALSNRALINQKQNTIVNTISPGIIVAGDENMIKAVFRNLVLNANKFTSGGTITLAAARNGDYIEVSIADTGVGIDPAYLTRLFSWNDRMSTNGTKGEKGSGFGLQVCKEFVERNGGRMWVESTVGVGSVFYFSLPRF